MSPKLWVLGLARLRWAGFLEEEEEQEEEKEEEEEEDLALAAVDTSVLLLSV